MVEKLKGDRGKILVRPVAEIHQILHRRLRIGEEFNRASFTGAKAVDHFDLIAENKRKIWTASMII